jgi:hypothetical protein
MTRHWLRLWSWRARTWSLSNCASGGLEAEGWPSLDDPNSRRRAWCDSCQHPRVVPCVSKSWIQMGTGMGHKTQTGR